MQSAANGHSMKVFVFHDADPSGYGIARAIGEAPGAHRFDFEVIDSGLRLGEALEMELETETFIRNKSLPNGIEFTETERKLFSGVAREYSGSGKNGKPKTQWVDCERVELNALAASPERFVAWVEKVLTEHGAAKKLVPPKDEVITAVRQHYKEQRLEAIRHELLRQLGVEETASLLNESMAVSKFNGIVKKLAEWSADCPPESWQGFISRAAADAIAKEPISEAVRSSISTNR